MANKLLSALGAATTPLTGTDLLAIDQGGAELLKITVANFCAGLTAIVLKVGPGMVVGTGLATADGTLHVHTATAGAVTASTAANTGVFENSGNGGISILTPDASVGAIIFGSPTSNSGAAIQWGYSLSGLYVGTAKVGASTILRSGNEVTNLTLSGASGSELATFAGDVTLSEGRLTITDTANENAITVTTSQTGSWGMQILASSLIDGGAIQAYSNSADTTARRIVSIFNDNPAATGTVALSMRQDAANAFMDFVGTAAANTTDPISTLTTSGATTGHIQVDLNGAKAWIAVSTNNPS